MSILLLMQLPEHICETVGDLLTIACNDQAQLGYVRDKLHDAFRQEIAKRGSGWVKMTSRRPEQSDSFGRNFFIVFLMPHGSYSLPELGRFDSKRHLDSAKWWCSLGGMES